MQARRKALPCETDDGLPSWTVHSAAATKEKFGAQNAVGAVSFPGASLSAYKLVCGLLQLALRQGLNLQTNTPASHILPALDLEGSRVRKWIVHTHRGQVVADNVILATNAYTSYLYPPLRHIIVPTRGQIAAQRPGAAFARSCMASRSYAFYRTDGTEDYMICRPPGSSGEGDVI